MIFGTYITPLQGILIGAGVLCTLVAIGIFLMKIIPVARRRALGDRAADEPLPAKSPGASIIVYSVDGSERLETLLPALLGQKYNGEFEVIVVNEGDTQHVRDVVEPLQITHRNLYLTHTPDGARNLSRKKLSITLGIKAARYDITVLTGADAIIDSPAWLSLMMRNFTDGTDIVLGYAAPAPYDDRRAGCRTRSFDFVADSLEWLSAAVTGHPWRGTGYNIAYRRSTFFAAKGFSDHLNLRDGDDDIFVSRIATGENTAVELSLESIVEIPGENAPCAARQRISRRRFTESFIHHRHRMLLRTAGWLYLGGICAPSAAAAIAPYSPAVWTAAGVAAALWYGGGMVWIKARKALCGRRLLLTLPLLLATRPIRLMWRRIYALTHRSKRYTWE